MKETERQYLRNHMENSRYLCFLGTTKRFQCYIFIFMVLSLTIFRSIRFSKVPFLLSDVNLSKILNNRRITYRLFNFYLLPNELFKV